MFLQKGGFKGLISLKTCNFLLKPGSFLEEKQRPESSQAHQPLAVGARQRHQRPHRQAVRRPDEQPALFPRVWARGFLKDGINDFPPKKPVKNVPLCYTCECDDPYVGSQIQKMRSVGGILKIVAPKFYYLMKYRIFTLGKMEVARLSFFLKRTRFGPPVSFFWLDHCSKKRQPICV